MMAWVRRWRQRLPWAGLSADARRGLLAHALHWQAVSIGSLYTSIYFFRLSHGFAVPAWHVFCSYLLIPPGYALGAWMTRRWGAGTAYRAGVAVYGVFQGIILWLGTDSVQWAGTLGAWWGIGVGLYWQGWVLLIMDLSVDGADREAMMGSNQAVYFLANFTAAPLAGWFLSRFEGTSGYPWAFGASLALFAAAAWVSLPLRGKALHGSSAFGRLLRIRKPRGWTAIFFSSALMGVMSVGALFLPMLLSYAVGRSEGLGGLYALFVALLGFLASWSISHWGAPKMRGSFMLVSAGLVFLLSLPLALHRSFALILCYGVAMALHMGLFNVTAFAAHISLIEAHPRFRHRRADAMALREIGIAAGRCLASGAIVWGVVDVASMGLTWLIVGVALTPFLNYLVMRPHLTVR